jgi:hypothetical protein
VFVFVWLATSHIASVTRDWATCADRPSSGLHAFITMRRFSQRMPHTTRTVELDAWFSTVKLRQGAVVGQLWRETLHIRPTTSWLPIISFNMANLDAWRQLLCYVISPSRDISNWKAALADMACYRRTGRHNPSDHAVRFHSCRHFGRCD